MEQSFYIGALGALGQQSKLNVVSNNIANVNTVGFKAQYSAFSDLVYAEMRNSQGKDAAKSGSGTKVDQTKTDFSAMAYKETGLDHDYAIAGEGFFMLKDPVTGETSYSRDGRFQLSRMEDKFYLVNSDYKRVLNMDKEEISYDVKPFTYPDNEADTETEDTEIQEGEHDPRAIGIYTFARMDGMESQGDNVYAVSAKNGEPILLEKAKVVKGALEESGVNFGQEMARMIEAQRAYSYALKMVQTSDEVESTINSLR